MAAGRQCSEVHCCIRLFPTPLLPPPTHSCPPLTRQLLERTAPALLSEVGVSAMRELQAAPGDRRRRQARQAAASRLIASEAARAQALEACGCWEELAGVVKVRAGWVRW